MFKHIIAIAWIYVVSLMAFTESSITAGLMTMFFYCLVPLGVLWAITRGKKNHSDSLPGSLPDSPPDSQPDSPPANSVLNQQSAPEPNPTDNSTDLISQQHDSNLTNTKLEQ